MPPKIKVLMVCLGNICRSPMAEALFRHKLEQQNLSGQVEVASAGTGAYHIGENADPRTLATLRQHGIAFSHRAQQATAQHFQDYDYLLAMDQDNAANLRALTNKEEHHHKLSLMLSHQTSAGSQDVPDPYFGGNKGFEEVYQMLDNSLDNFLNMLIEKHKLRANE